MDKKIEELNKLERKMHAYNHAMSMISFDAVTSAPQDSSAGRGETLGILSEISHDLFINPRVDELLKALEAEKGTLDEITARRVHVLREDFDRESKIPTEELVEYEKLVNKADNVWHQAKAKNDYAAFEPYLNKLIAAKIKIAKYYDPNRDPYDTWLDMFEKGYTRKELDEYFAKIKAALVPLVRKVVENDAEVSEKILHGHFPVEKQRELSDYIMSVMGIDRSHCSIGETEHPFTDNFNKNDVRITTKYLEDNLTSSMYSVIHEGGHALYELHSGDEFEYTCLAGGASMGIHESQSRFYENIIGRSEEFIDAIFPKIRELFPEQYENVSAHDFYLAVNRSHPSLIRTEADELTYSMHIMVRYEIEKMLFDAKITTKELPDIWAKMMKEYLGVDVPDDKHGVLQDSHWAGGMLGYFPSYALGSAFGAQILNTMEKDFNPWEYIKNGQLCKITEWLAEHIFRFSALYDPSVLLEKCCGEKFNPDYYINYLTQKYSKIYNLK